MVDKKVIAHREAQRKYKQTLKGKLTEKRYRKTESFRKSNTFKEVSSWKRNVWYQAQKAMESGMVKKKPCEICGDSFAIVAHHPDYHKPIDVVFLCRKHHREVHYIER